MEIWTSVHVSAGLPAPDSFIRSAVGWNGAYAAKKGPLLATTLRSVLFDTQMKNSRAMDSE